MDKVRFSREWRVVAASVRGKSHEKTGQLCQDAHNWQQLPSGVLVAAVADGAGSAALGEVGAAVAAETAVATIFQQGMLEYDATTLKLILTEALKDGLKAVEAVALKHQKPIWDFATTLILAIATSKWVAVAQIGDGAVIVGESDGNLTAIATPQSGEFINETTFLTSPDALETAQINVWQGNPTQIAMFSDGLQMLALKMPQSTPHAPFFSPLFRFVEQTTDPTAAKEQLEGFLRSPRVTERTDDDLTLLLATLKT